MLHADLQTVWCRQCCALHGADQLACTCLVLLQLRAGWLTS